MSSKVTVEVRPGDNHGWPWFRDLSANTAFLWGQIGGDEPKTLYLKISDYGAVLFGDGCTIVVGVDPECYVEGYEPVDLHIVATPKGEE